MRVNKAKRRLLRWQRYMGKTGSRPTNWRRGTVHGGLSKACEDVTYAKRYAPIGVREPWLPLWGFGPGRRA